MKTPFTRALGTAMLLFAGTACAQVRLHSPIRDHQATEVQKAWSGVELDTLIATERANLKTLLDAELATQDRLAKSIRDHTLRGMIGTRVDDGLVAPMQEKYRELAGADAPDAMNRVTAAMQAYKARANKIHALQPDFDSLRLGRPSCAAVAGGQVPDAFHKAIADPDRKPQAELLLQRLRDLCGSIQDDTGDEVYAAFTSGLIRKHHDEHVALRQALVSDRKAAVEAKREYDTALKNLADAQKKPQSASEDVREKAADLAKALDKLNKLPHGYAEALLSQERRDSLQALLQVVSSAEDGKVPDDTGKVGSSRVDLQACKLEYSIVSPK